MIQLLYIYVTGELSDSQQIYLVTFWILKTDMKKTHRQYITVLSRYRYKSGFK